MPIARKEMTKYIAQLLTPDKLVSKISVLRIFEQKAVYVDDTFYTSVLQLRKLRPNSTRLSLIKKSIIGNKAFKGDDTFYSVYIDLVNKASNGDYDQWSRSQLIQNTFDIVAHIVLKYDFSFEGHLINRLTIASRTINKIDTLPQNDKVVIMSSSSLHNTSIDIWNPQTNELVNIIRDILRSYYDILMMPFISNNIQMIAIAFQGKLIIWNGYSTYTIPIVDSKPLCIAFLPPWGIIIGFERHIYIYDIETRHQEIQFRNTPKTTALMVLSNNLICSASYGQHIIIKIWDPEKPDAPIKYFVLHNISGAVEEIVIISTDKLGIISHYGHGQILNIENSSVQQLMLHNNEERIRAIDSSDDGNLFVYYKDPLNSLYMYDGNSLVYHTDLAYELYTENLKCLIAHVEIPTMLQYSGKIIVVLPGNYVVMVGVDKLNIINTKGIVSTVKGNFTCVLKLPNNTVVAINNGSVELYK